VKRSYSIIAIVIFILVNVFYFGIGYLTEHVFPYQILRPARVTNLELNKYFKGRTTPSELGLKWEEFNITSQDSIKLKGWFIYANVKPANGTVFLLHSIGSCKASLLPVAKMITSIGFNCVLYDLRAHGESGGVNCTYGYYEKNDLSSFIDSVSARRPGSGPYSVFGQSLGGAIAIQAMAADKRIACVIAESPFTDLREITHSYFAHKYFLHINTISDKALQYSEQIAGFQIDSVSAILSARKIDRPVMIFHGIEDKKISASFGKRIFDNVPSRNKIWYPIFNAEHNNLSKAGGARLSNLIISFLKRFGVDPNSRNIPPKFTEITF
jgi:uncharacterized protein